MSSLDRTCFYPNPEGGHGYFVLWILVSIRCAVFLAVALAGEDLIQKAKPGQRLMYVWLAKLELIVDRSRPGWMAWWWKLREVSPPHFFCF